MINKDSTIPCPVCKTPIPFDAQSLLMGVSFSCPSCSASVGLSNQSRPIVEKTMTELETFKKSK
jgi:transcription initiation factor IIE alpha subunit